MQGLSVKQSKGSGCQTGQLKKSEGKKNPKTSLHQDSEVIQKGRNKKKKGKLKPRTETDSRNPTEGTKREKKQMPLRKL